MKEYRVKTVRRVARADRRCRWGDCHRGIRATEPYLHIVEFPNGESGYASDAGHPVAMDICHECAHGGYGEDLLVPAGLQIREATR